MKPKITNTATQPPGLEMFFPGSIEAQERRGQDELANSAQLPTDGSEHTAWAAMGVIFGPVDPSDPIFRPVTLPAGWKIERTDHSMWSRLVDDKGRERATIFYKAAFYDRSARVSLSRRINIRRAWEDRTNIQTQVADCGKRIYATAAVPKPDDWKEETAIEEAQLKEAIAWTVERFPHYEDPSAHWND